MDQYILSENPEHHKLIAFVCLILAAKSEDLDEYVPCIKDLLRFINLKEDLNVDIRQNLNVDAKLLKEAYRTFQNMYVGLEFYVFSSIEFNTIRPTCVKFINVFKSLIITEKDFNNNNSNNKKIIFDNFETMKCESMDFLYQFLEIVMFDIAFINIPPSLLAAAIIAAIRILMKVDETWNNELEVITRYKLDDFQNISEILIEKHEKYFKEDENNTDEDYVMSEIDDSGFYQNTSETDEDDVNVKSPKIQQDSKRLRLVV
jgi:hypothetical protein